MSDPEITGADGSGESSEVRGAEALTPENGMRIIAGLAVESWRFGRAFIRLLSMAKAEERGRFESQLRWFTRKVEEALAEAGMKIVTLEGSPYDPGMPAAALNIEDFGEGDELYVDQMLEPVIIDSANESLLRAGTVTLRKAGGEGS
ncbi:MAG: hypothetical protein LBR80_16945 [Deltaproteobacteria bacterium]|jgi:hypothetical protein|nr:hypothetical protein [Deltaproteobacteria bacterium]